MDRLARLVTQGSLALVLGTVVSSSGCRSMKSEIPPGKAYSTTGVPTPGAAAPSVGFSTDSRPDAGAAAGLYPDIQRTSGNPAMAGNQGGGIQRAGGDSNSPKFGTPIGINGNLATQSGGRFGPPGTSSLPPAASTATEGSSLPATTPSDPPASANPLQGALGVDLPNPN